MSVSLLSNLKQIDTTSNETQTGMQIDKQTNKQKNKQTNKQTKQNKIFQENLAAHQAETACTGKHFIPMMNLKMG